MTKRPPAAFEILVVCTGNICRSPMAAGLLQHLLPSDIKGRIKVGSAGTYALHGHQAAPHAVDTMARAGIDIRSHRAQQATSDLVRPADLVLTMERVHQQIVRHLIFWNRSRVKLLSEYDPKCDVMDIPDPYGKPPEAYQACLEIMQPYIELVISDLVVRMDVDA